MILAGVGEFASDNWTNALEILILAVGIYYAYLGLKGTRGLRVLTGLAAVILSLVLLSQLFGLQVISWLLRSLSAVVLLALVVIFQPELRRMLAHLGSHRLFGSQHQNREIVELLAQTAFDLSNRHLGALLAIERGTDIQSHIESGVLIDSRLSPELIVSIFHPKTPLHDGGLIVRNDRVISASCIFPVSQRQDLDRNLGLRHRAAIGLTEESDAVVLVVSEETGAVSLCYRGKLERDLAPTDLRKRLSELLLMRIDESPVHPQPGSEGRLPGSGSPVVGGHPKEPVERTNDLAA
ncbi:MAG: diadenylate cyclase CdaA [Chthoniobacteraceae bacterium]